MRVYSATVIFASALVATATAAPPLSHHHASHNAHDQFVAASNELNTNTNPITNLNINANEPPHDMPIGHNKIDERALVQIMEHAETEGLSPELLAHLHSEYATAPAKRSLKSDALNGYLQYGLQAAANVVTGGTASVPGASRGSAAKPPRTQIDSHKAATRAKTVGGTAKGLFNKAQAVNNIVGRVTKPMSQPNQVKASSQQKFPANFNNSKAIKGLFETLKDNLPAKATTQAKSAKGAKSISPPNKTSHRTYPRHGRIGMLSRPSVATHTQKPLN